MSAIAPSAVSEAGPLAAGPSKATLWTGRVLSALVVLFLLFDSTLKFLKPAPVIQGFAQFGIPIALCIPIALTLLICTLLPSTSAVGAILLTGYVGVLLWLGLYLRDPRLRALIPFRSSGGHAL